MFTLAVESAHVRAEEFVRRTDKEIAVKLFHIDEPVGRVMHRVNKGHCAGVVRQPSDFLNRIDGSHRVGRVAHGYKFGAAAQFALQIFEIERAVFRVDAGHANDYAFFLKRLPRREVGVVIEGSE